MLGAERLGSSRSREGLNTPSHPRGPPHTATWPGTRQHRVNQGFGGQSHRTCPESVTQSQEKAAEAGAPAPGGILPREPL